MKTENTYCPFRFGKSYGEMKCMWEWCMAWEERGKIELDEHNYTQRGYCVLCKAMMQRHVHVKE